MLLPQSSAFAALKNRLNSVSSIGYLHIGPRPYVLPSTVPPTFTPPPFPPPLSRPSSVAETVSTLQGHTPRSKSIHDTHASSSVSPATTPSTSSYDRPNRLGKGREDGTIRWDQLLEKFRSVQDRARRAQRMMDGSSLDDGPNFSELRIAQKEPLRPAPAVPPKDATPVVPPKKTGLGRQFGRLGASVSGRGKRNSQQN